MLTANYYKAKPSPVLDIVQLVSGHRTPVISFNVKNKREARQVAETYGALAWNF